MMQTSLNLGLLFFGVYTISIVIALRFTKKISPTLWVCSLALSVYFFALILIGILGVRIYFFPFSSFYWFLTLCLLMFFGAIYKSISLQMMLHLFNQPGKTDFYEVILERYIKDQSYINRIEILLSKKMIERQDNASFSLTKKGNSFAKHLTIIQHALSIKESG